MESLQYIWQLRGWPRLSFDGEHLAEEVALARRAQGLVEGKLAALGFQERQDLAAEAWAQEALATAAIEGERLDLLAVRSSIAQAWAPRRSRARRHPATSMVCSASWTTPS